jgi:hypothetical protein
LQQLRDLQTSHPDDITVLEVLASGLLNELNDDKNDQQIARRDTLLEELRALRRSYPKDPSVRERLIWGLISEFQKCHDQTRLSLLAEELADMGVAP